MDKKLSDNEIVKALEEMASDCPANFSASVLDLIHRLQSENAKQKAEIERLTKKLDITNEQLCHSCMDKGELQKQVDELKKRCEIAEGTKSRLTIFDRIEIHDKAVKDTAKEIANWLVTTESDKEDLAKIIKEHYGVEVE